MITIDIWSDIRCPFCYIGKTRLEQALQEFEAKDEVVIRWKAFELDPALKTNLERTTKDYFSAHKGMPVAQVDQMFAQVTQTAAADGLHMDLEGSITANSFKAHQLSYFAQTQGLQNELEEALFQAHFSRGINIDDVEQLVLLAQGVGLDAAQARLALEQQSFATAVEEDENTAHKIGINSVPFFIVNNKYALKGAQSKEYFLESLQGIHSEKEDEARS